MSITQSCPINFKKVDQNIIRMQAGIISISAIAYLLTQEQLLLNFLLYDFFVRIIGYKKFSVVAIIANFVAKKLSFTKDVVDAGPKQFAAQIGLIFVFVANLFYYLNFAELSFYTIAILVFCALLEACFGICVGCKVYPLYNKIFKNL